MTKRKDSNHDRLQEDLERKAAKKRKRKKPMPMSGKSVFTLKRIIEKKSKKKK